MKSLTSKRLSDFLGDSNKSVNNLANHEKPPSNISANKTFDKFSIINLEPAMLGTDEMVDEAPFLFVGKSSFVNPTQNLQDIIESYKVFKEISTIEEVEESEFGLVPSIKYERSPMCNIICSY